MNLCINLEVRDAYQLIGRRKALEAHQAAFSEHDSPRLISANCRAQDDPDKAPLGPEKRQRRQLVNFLIHSLQSGNTDNARVIFPLSTDHLIPLIQFNVLRAVLTNMALLRILDSLPQDCDGYTFCHMPLYPTPDEIPPQLRPTRLQNSVPHPLWIDIIPSPTLRDNFIRLAETIDEDEICSDFIGGLFEGDADIDARGWIVWNDPWDTSGWEMTEGFVKKWGFVLKGCTKPLEATNRWRRKRGEEELVVEV